MGMGTGHTAVSTNKAWSVMVRFGKHGTKENNCSFSKFKDDSLYKGKYYPNSAKNLNVG